jgi:LacI family transcriptional regulator
MAVTISDVAARAGVSSATVSRVLNDNYPVATQTRARVERVVRELDYVVNAHARALLHAHSGMVGVVLNDVSDPFFASIARGVQSAAVADGRLVLMCNSDGDPHQELAYVQMLRRQRADAIILTGAAPEDRKYRSEVAAAARGLLSQDSRLVLCGRPAPNRAAPVRVVSVDNAGGSALMAEHLLAEGHRRIAYITGPTGRTTTTERLRGFTETLRRHRVAADARLVVPGDFSRSSGYDATRSLLASKATFTAIYAANDLMAVGALAALREAKVRVPRDVSVVGFDDIPMARDMVPALTTVRVDLEEAGRSAVALAFRDEAGPGSVHIGAQLVVRDSVKRLTPGSSVDEKRKK